MSKLGNEARYLHQIGVWNMHEILSWY